jgi:hypothetical protein
MNRPLRNGHQIRKQNRPVSRRRTSRTVSGNFFRESIITSRRSFVTGIVFVLAFIAGGLLWRGPGNANAPFVTNGGRGKCIGFTVFPHGNADAKLVYRAFEDGTVERMSDNPQSQELLKWNAVARTPGQPARLEPERSKS